MNDGTSDRMLCLLQGKLEPCRWLNVRRASQVFDAVPRDVVEPLEVDDLFIHAECLASSRRNKSCSSSCGWQLLRPGPDTEQSTSVSAAVLVMFPVGG